MRDKNTYAWQDEKYRAQFVKVLENMVQSGIPEYKIARTYERAKLLSVNLRFQQAVRDFRERWNIEPFLLHNTYPSPAILTQYIIKNSKLDFKNHDELRRKLDDEMRAKLCHPFGLELLHDMGLILTALCIGLTPENILGQWDKLEGVAAVDTSPGVTLVIDNIASRTREILMDWLLALYLVHRLAKTGTVLGNLTSSLRGRLRKILDRVTTDGKTLKLESIPQVIEMLESKIQLQKADDYQLFIRIEADTTLADVQRTWPQVEARKLEIFGPEKPRRSKSWTTYERDIELQQLYDKLDDYSEVVREYDRRHPDTKLVNDENYTKIRDDVLDLVRQAVKRTRDRMTATHIP